MSNAVACVVVSIWENACDRDVLKRELAQDHVGTELAPEEEATIAIAPSATPVQPIKLH